MSAPLPFVSCICPTKNRRIFLRRSLEYYHRAARLYEREGGKSEFIIVDASTEIASYPVDRYIWEPTGPVERPSDSYTGRARNLACEAAKGDIIVHWDDDDWQHEERILRQVRSLLTVPGGLTYSSSFYWYHVPSRQSCRSRTWNLGGGTMGAIAAYWRSAWQRCPFPNGGSEDVVFMREHVELGTPVVDSMDPELVVYMRHATNYSALTHYDFTDDATRAARGMMGGDVEFYDEIAEISQPFDWTKPNAPGAMVRVHTPLERLYLRHFR
jgi:O-antigen biosynthesis protein